MYSYKSILFSLSLSLPSLLVKLCVPRIILSVSVVSRSLILTQFVVERLWKVTSVTDRYYLFTVLRERRDGSQST